MDLKVSQILMESMTLAGIGLLMRYDSASSKKPSPKDHADDPEGPSICVDWASFTIK